MLDNLSYRILKALSKDGRYSYTKLARELKTKVSTVSNKVSRMLEEGLISIQAVPNPYKIGYKFQVVIALNVDLKQIDKVCDALMDNSNVSSIATMFGRFNILVFAEFPTIDMLFKIVRETLPNIDGVTRIDTFFVSERKRVMKNFSSWSRCPANRYPLISLTNSSFTSFGKTAARTWPSWPGNTIPARLPSREEWLRSSKRMSSRSPSCRTIQSCWGVPPSPIW